VRLSLGENNIKTPSDSYPIEKIVMQSNNHILVTGSNRSGTTWAGKMLALSNQIRYIEEPFGHSHRNGKAKVPEKYHFHYVKPNESAAFKTYIDGCLSPLNFSLMKAISTSRSPRDVAEATYRKFKDIQQALLFPKRAVIKDPRALFSAPWFYETYNCHVLILIRHPTAYVSSIKRVGWRSNPRNLLQQNELIDTYLSPLKREISAFVQTDDNIIEEAVLRWRIYHHVIRIYRETYPWIFKRHEDLSLDPIVEFQNMYQSFGIPFTQRIHTTISKHSKKGNPLDPGKKVHMLKRDSIANIRRWKHTLSTDEVGFIYENTHALAREFYPDASWM